MRWVVAVVALILLVASIVLPAGAGDQAFSQTNPAQAIPDQRGAPEASLIGLSFAAGDKLQQVTVIDPKRMVMSVYHIDATTGNIQLKSVRRIEWDLDMVHFNTADPLPQEIRSIIQQHR